MRPRLRVSGGPETRIDVPEGNSSTGTTPGAEYAVLKLHRGEGYYRWDPLSGT